MSARRQAVSAMQQLHAWELQGQVRLHGNGEGCRCCWPPVFGRTCEEAVDLAPGKACGFS